MKRYVIERDLPGVGTMNRAQFKDVATTSNNALAKLVGKAQWEHSYIVENKSFCIYLAEDEAAVKEHAKLEWLSGDQGDQGTDSHRMTANS
ncbi:MAG: DUF4242 domain-containing protein [Pseudolabrys sp.]